MKRLSLAGLVLGLGLLLGQAPAQAITLTATAQNPVASGTYNVVVNPLGGNSFQVIVTGNNDGRTVANGPLEPVKHSVGRVSVGFLRGNGTFIGINEAASNNGATTTGGGFVGAAWTIAVDSDVARYNSPSEMNDVAPFGGNQFSAIITLSSADTAEAITVALQDGTQQWFAAGVLIPEPISMAMLLPGLLPLAAALRRRSRKQPEEEPAAT